MTSIPSSAPGDAIEEYAAPSDLNAALAALGDGSATVLAGGTDLMVQTSEGRIAFQKRLVNIRRIDELRGVTESDGRIRIGALTTLTDLLDDPLIAKKVPLLAEMADHFASNQIRNSATIGGNICNASPAGDSIPPLLVLDADVELASDDGLHTVPLGEFFTGPGATVREPNELVTGISFATPGPDFIGAFIKSGPRPALEISTVSMAISAERHNNVLHNVRVAMGAVAPTPIRAWHMEEALEGRELDAATIEAAVERALEDAVPIDDVRASAWYRNHLVGVFARRLLNDVAEN